MRSLIGALLALVAFAPVWFGAAAVRRRYVPALAGPPAALGTIVIGLGAVVGVVEILGAVGCFRLVPLTLALASVGIAGARLGSGPIGFVPPPVPALRPTNHERTWNCAAVFVVAVVAAQWATRVGDVWRRGIVTSDSLWYHLPIAARFAQDGWTTRLHFVDQASLIVFFPATSELLHAIGMVFLGNDFLSLVLNLGWLALALFAGWCIGVRFGVAPLTLIAVAIVCATPELVLDDAGTGLNDIVGIALFLAAVALVTNATRPGVGPRARHAEMSVGAIAAGLAAGTKYTMVVPVVALAVVVLALTPCGGRVRSGAQWCGVAFLGCGYWYVRNLLRAGNPIPSMQFGIGPLRLRSIPYAGTSSVAHALFRAGVWHAYLLPGLREAFGPLWWGYAVIVAAGAGVGLSRGDAMTRLLALIGAACLVAFVVTPQILGSPDPVFFAVNARYMATAVIVGVVVLPIALRNLGSRVLSGLLAFYVLLLVLTQLAPSLWRNRPNIVAPVVVGSTPFVVGVGFGVVVLAVGCVLSLRGTGRHAVDRHHRSTVVVAAALIVVVGVGAGVAERVYLHRRYRVVAPLTSVDRWARGVHHSRIAIVDFVLQYPLYGTDLSNRVQYLAIRHRDGSSEPISSCEQWRRAVNAGRYRYVVTASPGFPFPPSRSAREDAWTRSDPSARLVAEDDVNGAHAWVYAIEGAMDSGACTA